MLSVGASLPVAPYSGGALLGVPAPELEQFHGGPSLAPAPGVPEWLVGAEQVGPNLYYVSVGQNNASFYTVSLPNLCTRLMPLP